MLMAESGASSRPPWTRQTGSDPFWRVQCPRPWSGGCRGALTRIETAIRHVAEAHGAPQKYHRTMTEAWAALVGYHLAEEPVLAFDEFLARFPGLLDRGLLKRHFSAELLATPAARATWVDPDLRPLPART
jgi:hypothetical protein